MTDRQAQDHAARMGLSVWQVEAIRVGNMTSEPVTLKCVGFASVGFALAEAETWDEALLAVARLIYTP